MSIYGITAGAGCGGASTMSTQIQGLVIDPAGNNYSEGSFPVLAAGKSGELLTSGAHGKYYNANVAGAVFCCSVTGVTVPAIANNLVSVFSFYNPSSSGVNAELIDLDINSVLATTVVDTFGLYYQTGASILGATYTTIGVAGTNVFSGMCGVDPAPGMKFYSALTHAGTPVRWRALGSNWAVTSTAIGSIHVDFDGKAIIPPGTVVSLAASTAAGTSSGLGVTATWAEFPA